MPFESLKFFGKKEQPKEKKPEEEVREAETKRVEEEKETFRMPGRVYLERFKRNLDGDVDVILNYPVRVFTSLDKEITPEEAREIFSYMPVRFPKESGGLSRKEVIEAWEKAFSAPTILESKSFEELFGALDALKEIKGTQKTYSSTELMGIINAVREGGDIHNVTRSEGLRDKVTELLDAEAKAREEKEKESES